MSGEREVVERLREEDVAGSRRSLESGEVRGRHVTI